MGEICAKLMSKTIFFFYIEWFLSQVGFKVLKMYANIL